MMDLYLSGSSPLPIYRQLFDQLCAQILDGRMKSGDALPPIRTVARELSISVIPVKRAWEELESAGFIESFVGRGCFIAPMSADKLQRLKQAMAADRLSDAAAYCKGLGLSLEEAEKLLREAWTPKE